MKSLKVFAIIEFIIQESFMGNTTEIIVKKNFSNHIDNYRIFDHFNFKDIMIKSYFAIIVAKNINHLRSFIINLIVLIIINNFLIIMKMNFMMKFYYIN